MEESKPSRHLHCWNPLKYWAETYRPKTCHCWLSRESPRANAGVRKIAEREIIKKLLGLGGEVRKLWNIRITVIPVVISAHRMVERSLEERQKALEINGRTNTIPTQALLRSTSVGYHLPFRHNELVHLPYMAVASNTSRSGQSTISLVWMSTFTNLRLEEPFILLKYILTLTLTLCSYY